MSSAVLSTKGQLVIPNKIRKALHLHPGDKILLTLEAGRLILQRDEPARARLVERRGRKVLVAPRGAPPMNSTTVRELLADFP
jgi:AbrB family looped-hinge helix DNA binding protein